MDRLAVELTPQLCSGNGLNFISTRSLSSVKNQAIGKVGVVGWGVRVVVVVSAMAKWWWYRC